QKLRIKYKGEELGDLDLRMPGEHNVQNVLAAMSVCIPLGVSFADTKRAVESFPGLWRRFEYLGVWHGADMYSDYAHNPMSVAGLLEGTRSFLPNRRIILFFEPHQHARTKGLFADFIPSMNDADAVVISEIYAVEGRKIDEGDVSSQDLVDAVREHDKKRGVNRIVEYAKSLDDARGMLETIVKDGDILLMAGAGNIDEWARGLVKSRIPSPK
ncbi:MAG: cyanophycin synthetase, partial [Patescibacteria group bacterium]